MDYSVIDQNDEFEPNMNEGGIDVSNGWEDTNSESKSLITTFISVFSMFLLFIFFLVNCSSKRNNELSTRERRRRAAIQAARNQRNEDSTEMMSIEERKKYILNAVNIEKYEDVKLMLKDKMKNKDEGQCKDQPEDSNDSCVDLESSQCCRGDNNDQCAICLDNFEKGDKVNTSQQQHSKCCHIYHYECIFEWLLQHSQCPVCRREFLPFEYSAENAKDLET